MKRRGQMFLLAAALLSLAILAYLYRVEAARMHVVYRGEAEWMILLAAARHSLAVNESLATLMARLRGTASGSGVWLPPVNWSVSRGSNGSGWFYRAVFYNTTLGWQGYFAASASYALLGAEYDDYGNLWLVYNLSYIHEYKLPQYSYPITLHPAIVNTTCVRSFYHTEYTIVALENGCTARDKWGIPVLEAPGD